MKIVICGSLDFTQEMKDIKDKLESSGFEVVIPIGSRLILAGEITIEEMRARGGEQKDEVDAIRYYFDEIKGADAILVLNYYKNGIENYIGGNTLMEIGFAHVLNKKVFLLNPVPEMEFLKDEVDAVEPIILNGDLSLVK